MALFSALVTIMATVIIVAVLYQVTAVVEEIRDRLDWERDYWRQKERQIIATAIEAATVKPATPERIEAARAAVVDGAASATSATATDKK